MILRTLEWGKYPAQQADLSVAELQGMSVIVDGTSSNGVDATNYNPSSVDLPSNENNGNYNKPLWKLLLSKVRAQLGHSPVLVSARAWMYFIGGASVYTHTIGFFRLLKTVDWADVNYRYRDVSASDPFGNDAAIYSPVPGIDHHPVPFATLPISAGTSPPAAWYSVEMAAELADALVSNVDLRFMTAQYPLKQSITYGHWQVSLKGDAAHYPYFRFRYALPVEFFGPKADNTIDLQNMLNNALDMTIGNLLLGSVEKGETGTPVACFVKNLSAGLLPHLEVWDDSPEWANPVPDIYNAGSAALDHVLLLTTAVSQEYAIRFSSATEYEVKATHYGDNPTDLHGSWNSDPDWQGTIGSDRSFSGGLTIPAAAWSGTPVANDIIYVTVQGQTTDAAWPADSNIQVLMAKDNAGAPDDATWRPIKGQRTKLTSGVTIDATSKTLDVRYIDPALWATGTKGFVADATNIDEFEITSQSSGTLGVDFPSATAHVYGVGAKVCTTLPVRNLAKSVRATTTGAAGAGETNPAYIPLTGASSIGFATGQKIVIQSSVDDNTFEEAEVASADSSKIVCTALLGNYYETGAWVVAAGTGDQRFWLKLVTLPSTAEELKRGRLNART